MQAFVEITQESSANAGPQLRAEMGAVSQSIQSWAVIIELNDREGADRYADPISITTDIDAEHGANQNPNRGLV